MSLELPRATIHVVAGALLDEKGRVLIAQRPPGKHLAGGWEFPGGKLEPREDRRAGLARELREELGIAITTLRPLIRVRHSYDYGDVLIDMWVVRDYQGEPKGLDGQALRWCTRGELESAELLPADGPIVAALRLPERLKQVSTPEYVVAELGSSADSDGRLRGVWCAGMSDAIAASDAGADFLVLQYELSHNETAALCEMVPVPVYTRFHKGLALAETWALGATGTHQLSD